MALFIHPHTYDATWPSPLRPRQGGATPLHESARVGALGCVVALLGAGADATAKSMVRLTPIHMTILAAHHAASLLSCSQAAVMRRL